METGKKSGDVERVDTHTHVGKIKIWRDISAAKVPPEKFGVSTSCQDPQPRAPEPGKRACIASGSENKWRFCPPEREGSPLETQVLS